jgi:heat shock protein HslJ
MKTIAAIFFITSISLLGCSLLQRRGPDTSGCNVKYLNSKVFLLENINGYQIDADLFYSNPPTLSFHRKENKITGFAGCNRYFGSYKIIADSILFGITGATKMACNHLETEQKFLSGIGGQKFRWSIVDERLVLMNEELTVIFRIKKGK